MEKTDRELLLEISENLRQLVALQMVQGKSLEEQIQILRQMDFDWKFIGIVSGIGADAARKRSERKSQAGKVSKNGKQKSSG